MKHIVFVMVVLLVLGTIVGCGSASAGKSAFGKPISADQAITSAKEIADSPKAFEGKDVLVKGKITSECPSGGWVWINDGTGDIYVNMHPTNVFIPQKVGSTVKAMGKVVLEQGRPQVVGTGLEF